MNKPLLCGVLTLTPTHCGTGQAAGAVDLPIAREAHTELPILPATTLKGVVRDWFARSGDSELEKLVAYLFGPAPRKAGGRADSSSKGGAVKEKGAGGAALEAGNLVFLEGMLVAFPVRSLTGVFRWVTSPMLVARLGRVMAALGSPLPDDFTCPLPESGQLLVAAQEKGPVSLEDLVFPDERCRADDGVDKLAKRLGAFVSPNKQDPDRMALSERLVVVDDETLRDLVVRTTPVTARIVLDEQTKTSDNLWYEETLPADTLFAVVIADRPGAPGHQGETPLEHFRVVLELFGNLEQGKRYGQIGGNVTVGQGLVQWLVDVEVQ